MCYCVFGSLWYENPKLKACFFFSVYNAVCFHTLTVTLNWDTDMLLGWTLSRTHCLMSDAKRRGSDDRSHFSFLAHLRGKHTHTHNKQCYSWMTNTHMHRVTWPGLTPFHLLASGEKKNVPPLLTGGVTHIYHISSLAVHQLQWSLKGRPVTTGVGAVAFKTMAALYVEAELAHRERGRPSSL